MSDAPAFAYLWSGLRIASAIELPEWARFACAAGVADIAIRLGEGGGEADSDYARDGESVSFAIAGAGRWTTTGGHTIAIEAAPGADPAGLRAYTLGTALAAVCTQRGIALWHAACVERGGRALLLCGAAGAGKSTAAAELVAGGWRLVADDLCRVEPDGRVHRGATRMKLWGDAVARLGWRERVAARDPGRSDKFHCDLANSASMAATLPLAGILVLAEGEGGLERLAGGEALLAVHAATAFRPELTEVLGQTAAQAALVAQVLAHVPAWQLSRPRDARGSAALRAAAETIIAV